MEWVNYSSFLKQDICFDVTVSDNPIKLFYFLKEKINLSFKKIFLGCQTSVSNTPLDICVC